jgi:hypothetical protein
MGTTAGLYGRAVERVQLISLLVGQTASFAACREALEGGASFGFGAGLLPARHYAAIYKRRERHTRQAGIPTVGFAEAVKTLDSLEGEPLQIAAVRQTDPPHYFQLFLTADRSAVVACIGVDQQHQAGGTARQPDRGR